MQAVRLYLTMSATDSALRMVTTVMLGAGDAMAGACAAPTVRFVLMDVTSVSPSCKSSTYTARATVGCVYSTLFIGIGIALQTM